MSAKIKSRPLLGAMLVAVILVVAAVMLVPSFATGLARLIADLWVTVMGAVAGLLGGVLAR